MGKSLGRIVKTPPVAVALVSKPLKEKGLALVTFWQQDGDSMQKLGSIPPEFAEMVRELVSEASGPHGNSKSVCVVSVDDEEARKWWAPRSRSKPVEEGHIFSSALAASIHLGYHYNEVGIRLSYARKKSEQEHQASGSAPGSVRLRPSITIRGVTLQYEEDVPG